MTNWEERMKEKNKMAKLRSDSPTCRRIVLAILDFLDSVQPSAGIDFEGVGVARDCLEHVFKINACAFSDEIQPGMLIDMFSSREHAEGCKLKSVLGTSPLECTSCARSSLPRVQDSSGLKNAASDLGKDPIAQPALSGNSSSSFNSLSTASLSTEFFPNKYRATTQPAGSTNHSAPPPYFVSTPVDIASQSRTVASQRHPRRMLVGNSEEPSEPEIRIASSNTGLHHEQTWTTRSTGPSNPRISTRVLPVGTRIPPSIKSIYGTTSESTEQMNSSTQSTSSPSIPAAVVNFFRTMDTASPSHQGRDSRPNENQEASVGTLIPPSFRNMYGTTLESTRAMNSNKQYTSSPYIPVDVINFFRTLHTASPSHQGHDGIPNGNQEASVGTLTPPSFSSIYGTTFESTGQMSSSTQSTSSPSIPADVVNFFRTLHTASPSHQGHDSIPNGKFFQTLHTASQSHQGRDSIPNGNQEASVGTLTPPSFTSIYGTTLESTGQMNSSTQSTSSPSIPADVVNFFRTLHTASQCHQGHDSIPNGNQEASVGTLTPPSFTSIYGTTLESTGQMNSSTQSTSSPSIPADVISFFRNMHTASQSHQGRDSRPNGNQEASGQRNSITSSPIAVPPAVVNWLETMFATPHSHHNDQSRQNGNQEASGQRSSRMYIPPDVINLYETMSATNHSHHGDQSRPNGNKEASGSDRT